MFFHNNPFSQGRFPKGKVRQLCEVINCGIHPLQNLKVLQFLEKAYGFEQDKKNIWLNEWIIRGLAALEKILISTSGKFAFGDKITAADMFIIPQVFSAERFNIDVNQFPLISKINKTCLENEAFQKAHPSNQIDAPAGSS